MPCIGTLCATGVLSRGMGGICRWIYTSQEESAQVSQLGDKICNVYCTHQYTQRSFYSPEHFPFPPEFAEKPLALAKTLFLPMWLFVASGLAIYVPLALHILHVLVRYENIGHILHSVVS